MKLDTRTGPTPEELARVNEHVLVQTVLQKYTDQIECLKSELALATAKAKRYAEENDTANYKLEALKRDNDMLVQTGFDTLVRRIVTDQMRVEFEERGL